MSATAAIPISKQQYYPTLEAGATDDQVVFYVDPRDPYTYVVYFPNVGAFGESVRVLEPGHNTFVREAGSTETTGYCIVPVAVDMKIREIPPKP